MTPEHWIGVIAGFGWGLFFGGAMGAAWFAAIIRETADEEPRA